jgi:serine/arginine repetitive matrix protein 2
MPTATATPPVSRIPTIRLTHATPSSSSHIFDETLLSPDSIISESPESIRRIVKPQRSKLNILTGTRREREFSDITRRLGVHSQVSDGDDVYIDPSQDPDIGEIVVVKKKKSRAALDGIRWALGDKTNTNMTGKEENSKKKTKDKVKEDASKTKSDESSKWWTIGRGKKDTKEKQSDKTQPRPKCKYP